MDMFRSHIINKLTLFINERSNKFDLIFHRMHHPLKQQYKMLLAYVDNLLNAWDAEESANLRYLHLHFPFFEADQVVLLEYLCIRLFLSRKMAAVGNKSDIRYMRQHIALIEKALALPMHLGEANKKKELEKKTEYRKGIKKMKDMLTDLEPLNIDADRSNYRPTYLVNVLKKDKDELEDNCAPSPFFMSTDHCTGTDLLRPVSYVFLNDQLSRDELDVMEIGELKDILDHIEQVVLFNSDGKSVNRQFSFPNIKKLNAEGLNIKRLIILSFDQKPLKLEKLIVQLNTIAIRYLEKTSFAEARSYTIMPWEVDALTDSQRKSPPTIELIGNESLYWKEFQECVNELEEMNELTSIKMRNIYSLCMSDAYKKLLLTDLFSSKGNSSLLSLEARDNLKRLARDEQEELKNLLSAVLDAVQQEGLFASMQQLADPGACCIILPQPLFNHSSLKKLVMEEVRIYIPRATFKRWKEVKPTFEGNIIILDYRDPGRYPFRYHPNILEYTHTHAKCIYGLFLNMFFQFNYEYALYEFNSVLYGKVLDHPIRQASFDWETLLGYIRKRKDDQAYDHLWDLDNNYSNLGDRDQIVVTFAKGSKRSFYPSELFVVKYPDNDQLGIIKAEDVHEDKGEYANLCIQPLGDLYEGINLFETTIEEESEIKILKAHFQLPERLSDGGIWKMLLIRKVEQSCTSAIYGEVRASLSGLSFVKESYFADNWLNIKSDLLIPRSKKVFKALCTYLGLPGVYFRVMLKRRAKERLASRKSTLQMNRLIARLVEMGLFNDKPPSSYSFDKEFLFKYDLEEIGFNIEKLTDDLYAFSDLCKTNLDLKEVISTELKQST